MRYFRLCLKSNFGAKNRQETTIFYTRKMFIDARIHCTTTKKGFLAVVYALEKFWPYILGSMITIYTNHVALKY